MYDFNSTLAADIAKKIEKLSENIGYNFKNKTLLEAALTHPRVFQGNKNLSSSFYERLEFLGDRVLSLVIAEMLYKYFPDSSEGELSKRLTALVRQETLIQVSKNIQLPAVLHKVKGESEIPNAVIADSCEALIGALYLDDGLLRAKIFIEQFWTDLMKETKDVPQDNKSVLQEWAQNLGKPLPIYHLVQQTGPAHAPWFHITVQVGETHQAQGKGYSKKTAEQNAAFSLLQQIKDTNQ